MLDNNLFFGLLFSSMYLIEIFVLILFIFLLSVFFNKNYNDSRYLNTLISFYFCAIPMPLMDTVFRINQSVDIKWYRELITLIQNDSILYNLFVFYGLICIVFFFFVITDRFYLKKIVDLEFSLLILFIFLGSLLLMWIHTFIDFLISIEVLTLAGYTLAAYDKKDRFSTYAGVQYFILGAIPSAMLLLGSSFLYKSWGSLYFESLDLLHLK